MTFVNDGDPKDEKDLDGEHVLSDEQTDEVSGGCSFTAGSGECGRLLSCNNKVF